MGDDRGKLEKIWIKRAHRGPMDAVAQAAVHAGEGLEGDANPSGRRQVTLLSADRWEEVCHDLGSPADPSLRRANLLVRGVELAESRGRVLRVGEIRVLVGGETRPCRFMEESLTGLQAALDPDWRGGVYGEVLRGGRIAVGDPVWWEEPDAADARK